MMTHQCAKKSPGLLSIFYPQPTPRIGSVCVKKTRKKIDPLPTELNCILYWIKVIWAIFWPPKLKS